MIYLASQSPRRRELLSQLGLSFEVCPADVDEQMDGQPQEQVLTLSRRKAQAVAEQKREGLVIASDTLVAINGDVLGKPEDEKQAFLMLRKLSGNWHTVYTGVCMIDANTGHEEAELSHTDVHMLALTDEQIRGYIATGEPMDKAGAYGIQGYGGSLIDQIRGDYFTVMGLPMYLVRLMLEGFGVHVF